MGEYHLSVSQYARQHGISKMQVIRLIRVGKVPAERVGRNWLITDNSGNLNQINLEKTTSLQKWNKIIQVELHKNLKIEESKDRELIYAHLHSLGLPHERCFAFQVGKFPTKIEFEIAVGRIGLPYWISAVPSPKLPELNRQTKLGISNVSMGWNFINRLPQKDQYKIIIAQYPQDTEFKGTALISPTGNGMAEFITGDRHYIMTRGFTITDPMLFDQNKIRRYSKTILRIRQKKLYDLLRGIYGHLELECGKINNRKSIIFFDYNEEKAYIEIDQIWNDLVNYFAAYKRKEKKILYGLPASPGKVMGKCVVLHHEDLQMFEKVNKGDILISDTTTPEMTSLMGKTAAIITDLGGVTCHAAIVCRELKIPAIVGTRFATEILHTGDKVRVNADKGEIEIIN